MCILFFALNQHPEYPLIVAANRDEYHARPSKPMHQWPEHPGIFAGRDLEAGGTWLGFNLQGRFAAVTNFRQAVTGEQGKRSRGKLVSRFLQNEAVEQAEFEDYLAHHSCEYNPFNLVYGSMDGIRAWDHRSAAVRTLEPGFHSVSNGPIDELWPKMTNGVEKIAGCISHQHDLSIDKLLSMMQDRSQAAAEQLPQTGVNTEVETQLSSIFVRGRAYGTRTTTILFFKKNQVEVSEQDYFPDGEIAASQQRLVRLRWKLT